MKIDYSKWSFKTRRDNPAIIELFNELEGQSFSFIFDVEKRVDTDNIDLFIKKKCKEEIQRFYVKSRLEEFSLQKNSVEDNLEYLERKYEEKLGE